MPKHRVTDPDPELDDFLKRVNKNYKDDDDTPPDNAVFIMIVYLFGAWRVVMNVERRPNGKRVWGFPGGGIDPGDKTVRNPSGAWRAAKRELFEETSMRFENKHWDFLREVSFTRSKTRFFFSAYTGPLFRGDPNNREVEYVDFPRLSQLKKSLHTGVPLKCGDHTHNLRGCMRVLNKVGR